MFFKAAASLTLFFTLASGQTTEGCINSKCNTYKDINTLWCHSNSSFFCQCRTGMVGKSWSEQVMPCAAGTKFSFKRQTCVRPEFWQESECPTLETEMEVKPVVVDGPCSQPCTKHEDIVKLWCHPTNRKAYCQCRPTAVERVFTPVKMPCAVGTTFSFQRQTCVADKLWTDSCPT